MTSQINVCVLQASLVEEIVSMTGLDHVRDLTCVSLLACAFDGLDAKLLLRDKRLRSFRPPKSGNRKSGLLLTSNQSQKSFNHTILLINIFN